MRRRIAPLLGIVVLLTALSTALAAGVNLDDLRQSGVIGERYDGIAVVRGPSADPAVRSLVDSVNAKRRGIYEERAKKQGVSPVEVGKVYALEIAAKAPPGTWFLGEDGKWVQKK
jgi:uncharacterized protein